MFIPIYFFRVVFPFILNLNSFVYDLTKTQGNEDPSIHDHSDELVESNSMCGDGSSIQKGSSSGLDEINQVILKKVHMVFKTSTLINSFQNEEESIGECSNKDKYAVSLNVENEPVGPYMYELYAIIIHSGNISEGHYFAYIKDFKTNQWLCFNDQSVSEVC